MLIEETFWPFDVYGFDILKKTQIRFPAGKLKNQQENLAKYPEREILPCVFDANRFMSITKF